MNLRLLSHVLEDLVSCLFCDPFSIFFFFFFYYGTSGLKLLGFFFFFAYECPVILATLVEKTVLTLIILCQKSIICSCVGLFLDSAFISTFPSLHYLDCCSFA